MKEFILFCGLSGSGKSSYVTTYTKELHKDGYNVIVVSSDRIREEVYGDINDQTHNSDVFQRVHKIIQQWATKEYNEKDTLIIDATNVARKHRVAMLNILKQSRQSIYCCVYVMATPFDKCVRNDSERGRKVGKNVIFKQLCKFSVPQKFEGWDEVKVIHEQGVDYHNSYELMEKMIGVDQSNPHHKYTLFEHCMKARYIAEAKSNVKAFARAAQYHDIGKLFTKTTDKEGVAHYYNHANVSAYYMMVNIDLLYKDTLDYDIDPMLILFLIENHMLIRDIDKHCSEKYRKLWGNSWYEDVLFFSSIDEEATGLSKEEHAELNAERKTK